MKGGLTELLKSLWRKGLDTFCRREFIIFVFCGGMGTLSNVLVSTLISTRIDPVLSYICGYIISLGVTYTLNAVLIFHESLNVRHFCRFCLSYIPNFLILLTFVWCVVDLLHWHRVLAYIGAGLLGLPLTYVLVQIFAFQKKLTHKNRKE